MSTMPTSWWVLPLVTKPAQMFSRRHASSLPTDVAVEGHRAVEIADEEVGVADAARPKARA